MSTPLSAYQLRYNFTLKRTGIPEDIAVFGLWMKPLGGAEYGDEQLAHAAAGGYKAWAENVDNSYWTAAVSLSSVIATSYLANGHTLHEQNYVPTVAWDGGGDGPSLPWECAMAVSLYTYPRGTFVTNGKRKRGRYYLPPMDRVVLDPSNSGFFKDSLIPGFLSDQHDFLTAAQEDDLGVQIADLAVFSRTDSVLRPVVQLSLDAKIDSQRRRQNREHAGHVELGF